MMPMATAPMMNQGMAGSGNILAGLDQKMIKKIFNDVTTSVSDTLSQHAVEAVNQGVPYGHILDQILKMAPVSAGMKIGQDMMQPAGGGGGKPPDNGMSNSGGGMRPPQPPQAGVKNNQDQSQAITGQDSSITGVNQPPAQGQTSQGDGNSILAALLGAIQNGNGGQQFKMPSSFGGLIQPSAQDQVLLTQAAQNQQALAGKTPMQIGDLQRIIAGVGGQQMAANTVPLNAAERATEAYRSKELAAGGFTAQADLINKDQERIAQEEQATKAAFESQLNARGWLQKGMQANGPKELLADFTKKMNALSDQRDANKDSLLKLYGQHPNLKLAKSEVAGTGAEPTATNPTTGKKVVYRGGKWQPLTK